MATLDVMKDAIDPESIISLIGALLPSGSYTRILHVIRSALDFLVMVAFVVTCSAAVTGDGFSKVELALVGASLRSLV